MSRARDMANLGAQAGSGFDASDLITGTLGNTVQDNITRLGTVTTGTMKNTIHVDATFPTGHIIGVYHSGFNDGQLSFPSGGGTSGSITNTKTVNFNRKLSDSNFIITVLANRYRGGSSGRLRSGYTIGVGSLSTTYVGQELNKGEEDGSLWHNMSITYKDTTTGSVNDSMYFGTIFSNTGSVAYVRGVAIMVMEVVS